MIAVPGVFPLFLHALAADAKGAAALRRGRNARAHVAADRRYFDFAAANRFADGDRQIDVNVVAAPLEKWMRPHMDVNLNRWLPFARNANALSIGDAFRDFHFDAIAVDGEVHRCAENCVAEIDGELRFDLLFRHFVFGGATAGAEEIGENISEAAAALSCVRGTASACAAELFRELGEIESRKWIRAAARAAES